jgi:predicted ATPase
MLSWLCFVAVLRLEAPVSLLVFDEPETHLHPQMVQSVVGLCEAMADRTSVLVCTHSDRLLDALTYPEKSTVLLELDEKRAAKVRRPNAAELREWLVDYSGMGGLRAAGLTSEVFAPADETP